MIESIITAAAAFGIPANLLFAICMTESNLINTVNYNDPSYGLCQIKTTTALELIKKYPIRLAGCRVTNERNITSILMNKDCNLLIAAAYLKKQSVRYSGDLIKIISSYNAGSFTPKNIKYVKKVKRWL